MLQKFSFWLFDTMLKTAHIVHFGTMNDLAWLTPAASPSLLFFFFSFVVCIFKCQQQGTVESRMGASDSVVVVTVFFFLFLISFTSLSLSSSIPIRRWCLSDTLTKKDPYLHVSVWISWCVRQEVWWKLACLWCSDLWQSELKRLSTYSDHTHSDLTWERVLMLLCKRDFFIELVCCFSWLQFSHHTSDLDGYVTPATSELNDNFGVNSGLDYLFNVPPPTPFTFSHTLII